MFWFGLFYLLKDKLHKLYNHITNDKTELSAGVHSVNFELAPKSRLCSSSSQERKAQELQNWIKHTPLILKIQSHFYDTSGENYLTKSDLKVPYSPHFLCKNPLVLFLPVMMCKLTSSTPCNHHIWTVRL